MTGPGTHGMPDPAGFPWLARTSGPQGTRDLAARLAPLLQGGEIILLHGGLGAGKTCFTQGLCAALGVAEEVVSPTFTLVNSYRGRLAVHHLDFYRIGPGDDLGDIGVYDLLDEVEAGDAVLVVEWPGPLQPVLGDGGLQAEWLVETGDRPQDRLWRLRVRPEIPAGWRDLVSPSGQEG